MNPFAENLNRIMTELHITGSQIAKFAGFDRTNVSRLRSGARIPSAGGATAARLVQGIYLCADSRNDLPALCALTGSRPDESAEQIQNALSSWLFGEAPGPSARPVPRKRKPDGNSFGERLDRSMTLAELSNIRLSRLINVDASLISRYRSGVRTPRANPEMTSHLGKILWQRIMKNNRREDLARLMLLPPDEIDEQYFLDWLCDFDSFRDDGVSTAEQFLDSFDSYSAEAGIRLPSFEEAAPEQILRSSRDFYLGTAGLQEAVIRFLGNAVTEGAEELWLYSDQNMDWMTSDRAFLVRWAALMNACVKAGIRVRIIHNIDRSLREMNQAITSWLPLYMSGMIESWCCQKPKDTRFYHTLFLCPGHACIEACPVVGTEGSAIYRYYTDPEALEIYRNAYKKLLDSSKPLVRLVQPFTYNVSTSELTAVQNTLSIASMPEELVLGFGSEALKQAWERRRNALETQLQAGTLRECVPLAPDEALFGGRVPVEQLPGTEGMFYTPEQYSLHIRNIIRLTEQFPAYTFLPLPEMPFQNMRLVITPEFVAVTRSVPPYLTMTISHPLMSRAFREYADRLTEHYRKDRNSLRRMLENRYL